MALVARVAGALFPRRSPQDRLHRARLCARPLGRGGIKSMAQRNDAGRARDRIHAVGRHCLRAAPGGLPLIGAVKDHRARARHQRVDRVPPRSRRGNS